MFKKFLTYLILCLLSSPVFAGTVSFDNYLTSGTVTADGDSGINTRLNLLKNEINGGLNNQNTAEGFFFIESLSSLPAAGNQGRVVFNTTNNTLNFDTGLTFLATALLANTQTFSGTNTFSGNTVFDGTVTVNNTFSTAGTSNTIGNGGSDTLTLNVPGGMTLSAATTWTLTGALTVSGTIANLGTVTTADINGGTWQGTIDGSWNAAGQTASDLGTITTIDINGGTLDGMTIGAAVAPSVTNIDINGGTMDGVQVGGTTATGELLVNNSSDDADGLGSQGSQDQFLMSNGTGANPSFNGGMKALTQVTFTTASNSGDIALAANKRYKAFIKVTSVSTDLTILLRFNSDSTATSYSWTLDEINHSTTPASTLTGDDSDSEIELGSVNSGTSAVATFKAELEFSTNTSNSINSTNVLGAFGRIFVNEAGGANVSRQVIGRFTAGTSTEVTSFELVTSTGTMDGLVDYYELY